MANDLPAYKVIEPEALHAVIERYVYQLLPDIAELRRDLHKHPERGWELQETKARLLRWLRDHGIDEEPETYLDRSELVLNIELADDPAAPTVGLRSDMDALPILEQTGDSCDHRSAEPGLMHACGHDGHMAVLAGTLAAARQIQKELGSFPVHIRAIFQPAEEELCGGAELVQAGVCDDLQRVYALHAWPGLPEGTISSKPGALFAAAGTYRIRITGVSAHGAAPEEGKNPIIPAALLITALQKLHEEFAEKKGAVISTCAVNGGKNTNTIPEELSILGTTRYLDTETGEEIEKAIRRVQEEILSEAGVKSELQYENRYTIPVNNNEDEVERLRGVVRDLIGEKSYLEAERHAMTAEDFAFYLDRVPGCMFRLGVGENSPSLHSSSLDFPDGAIKNGMLAMLGLLFA